MFSSKFGIMKSGKITKKNIFSMVLTSLLFSEQIGKYWDKGNTIDFNQHLSISEIVWK